MGNYQSEPTVDHLNQLQNIYYIKLKMPNISKYPCFKGFRRISSDIKSNRKNKKIPYDKKTSYFLKLVSYTTEQERRCFNREQKLLKLFQDYPEIIKPEKIVNISLSQKQYFIVASKFYQSKDLFEYLWHTVHIIDDDLICNITFQCLKILKILKTHQVLHNNIKFENFIVMTEYPLKLALTGFKYSCKLDEREKSSSRCITSLYKSPEVLQCRQHDFAADMWSLGANIYLALFNRYPYEIEQRDNETMILDKIKKNELANRNMLASNEAWRCISAMLEVNPNVRITPEEALQLPWFDKLNKKPVKCIGQIIMDT
ncbi:hypothetical protein M9Y10_009947 [Tritrichomonas musculus]|uniref:Protein kinase domain-containing protein n=1 Tax=Tritrichomonas musculus TaxID=1915356 RepID=A0ABR2IRD6_9EUKA